MYLGIDTSNYTTSSAVFDGSRVVQKKQLLQVRAGGRGLQQSEAVFQHVKNLPVLMEGLLLGVNTEIRAVGASVRPRDAEGSYMPCFRVGEGAARTAAALMKVPFFAFSHQAGHIAAALYSADKLAFLNRRFIAFHVSGGTTEALLAEPGDNIVKIRLLAQSLDLKAGQAVDRVGVLMGLSFPCGAELEKLALGSDASFCAKPCLKGMDCCLSGIENQCADMLRKGLPKSDTARFCLLSISAALEGMTERILVEYPGLPVVFAGGVMSNILIRKRLEERFGAFFAHPQFSSDNAAGIAILTKIKVEGL